ncbi:hypothetical protein Fmac_012362 [Flemingia macrophylla]|uniref:R13L1/DRL21-like LRR repeat region domain-containing protein n=1 Tax=Flemingia macrophylla TaxID=520843 RepID=A0ABD1MQ36_9FABA
MLECSDWTQVSVVDPSAAELEHQHWPPRLPIYSGPPPGPESPGSLDQGLSNGLRFKTLAFKDVVYEADDLLDELFTKAATQNKNLVNLRHLAIVSCPLKEKPRGLRKLNHLQRLDFFIVGKNKENGIKELGGLSNLQGSFLIKNLENVTTSDEASDASIIDKKHIKRLYLEWTECNNNNRQFQIETDVLCKLQPHHELKRLTISGYQGTKFPDWVGNCYFHSMTSISLDNCNKCDMLPSLGQLPSLKHLCISKLNSVKAIDIGFYKNQDCSFVKPFPSLVKLSIFDMLCLEVWSSFDSDAFPLLTVLEIRNCPKLRGDLPNRLPSLKWLRIDDMPCWETWSSLTLDAFPLLERLNICRCPKLRGNLANQLPALDCLNIIDCELLVSSLPRAPVLRQLTISKSNKVVLDAFSLSVESIYVKGSPMVEYMMENDLNLPLTTDLKDARFPPRLETESRIYGMCPASIEKGIDGTDASTQSHSLIQSDWCNKTDIFSHVNSWSHCFDQGLAHIDRVTILPMFIALMGNVTQIMALAVVGGAFLSAFLDVVFDRLASPEIVNLIRGKKLDKKLLQKLEITLRVVRAVLDDAEKK